VVSGAAAVLFDFGGTLDADGVHWAPRFHAAYVAAGGSLEYASFEPVFKDADAALARLPGIERLGFRATVDAEARLLADRLGDAARLDFGRVADRFHADAVATVGRNRPVLERLARRHPLAVVSNFTGNLRPCLEELGLLDLFAVTTDSTVVGAEKPSAAIFLETLAALGAAPATAWMVGDNFEADIRPAARLGMRTCWLAPAARPLPDGGGGGSAPTARVARLPDVERVLG